MPNIAEFKQIIAMTPIDQAILLVGPHGIGKSECVKQIFEEQGYAIVSLFLGQNSDSGDILGLPDRSVVEFVYNGKTVQQKITEFCPPKWWPRNSDAKIIVFLDEFNRGKPEVYNCIMDMVLNRKLNGLELPVHTRIIAAQNPIGDEYDYDVIELDPALQDRFNTYDFKPSVDEWFDYGIRKCMHKLVLGFISKNNQQLDPPTAASRKSGKKYPSRRSWKRVSDIMNAHLELLSGDLVLLRTILMGVIGDGATAQFSHYIKESGKGISAAKIITDWNKEVETQVKLLSPQEIVHTNQELAIYLETNENTLFDVGGSGPKKYTKNLECYMRNIPKELRANLIDYFTRAESEKKKWADKVLTNNPSITNFVIECIHGETAEDKKLKANLNPENNIDDMDSDIQREIDDLLK